jgi:hypothetical protein
MALCVVLWLHARVSVTVEFDQSFDFAPARPSRDLEIFTETQQKIWSLAIADKTR